MSHQHSAHMSSSRAHHGGITAETEVPSTTPGSGRLGINVAYVLPKDNDIDEMLPHTKLALNQIQADCKVKLTGPKDGIINIAGMDKANVLTAIKRLSHLVEDEQLFFRPIFLIQHPPNSDKLTAKVITTKGPRRGQIEFFEEKKEEANDEEPKEGHKEKPKKETKLQALGKQRRIGSNAPSEAYLGDFTKTFTKFAGQLVDGGDKMRMRVHLGKYNLNGWQPSQLVQSYDGFEKMVGQSARKNAAHFQKRIGDGLLAQKLIKQVLSQDHLFEPLDANVDKLANVTPKKYILLWCHGFRFELQIDVTAIEEKGIATAGASRFESAWAARKERSSATAASNESRNVAHNASFIEPKKPKRYNQAVAQIQMFRSSKDISARMMTTVSPIKYYDWNLEVMSESAISVLPVVVQHIRQNTKIMASTKENLIFPVPLLSHPEINGKRIEAVAAKTVWTVGVKDTDTVVEVAFMREWPGSLETLAPPITSCGFSLHEKSWVRQLGTSKDARNFGKDFKGLFPRGIRQFLSEVGRFQAYLGEFVANQDEEREAAAKKAKTKIKVTEPPPSLLDDAITEADADALKNMGDSTDLMALAEKKKQQQSGESAGEAEFNLIFSEQPPPVEFRPMVGVADALFQGNPADAPPFAGPAENQKTSWGQSYTSLY